MPNAPGKRQTDSPKFEKYGLWWGFGLSPIQVEMTMIQKGGSWRRNNGTIAGNGTAFHFKELIRQLWPDITFHAWNNLIIENYLTHRTIVIIGPASSGKTHTAAICVLADYYCYPSSTTVLCCSTTRERLEDRIWGEIKKYHRAAKERYRFLRGNLIEGRQRIVSDSKEEAVEGRDFRSGLIGVPIKKGENYVGLGDFAGIKNKRVRLIGDELSLLPRVFVDAISNLDKNPDLKVFGLGNPKDTTDALGVLGEPSAEKGGWESGLDQSPTTNTWPIRRPDGICIHLPGTDSPNLDGKLGIPLITQEQIDRDVSFYGKDSLWYTMFCQGAMPRGMGSRRVLTRNFCIKHRAMEEPLWSGGERTKIGFLDAAYRGVGGDRCIFGQLDFGYEVTPPEESTASAIINQNAAKDPKRQIMALIDLMNVPIKVDQVALKQEEAEDQIVKFVMAQCLERKIPPQNFFFDSGMRSTLVSSFGRLWSPAVQPIDFGGSPSPERKVSGKIDVYCKDYYSKFVTELWFTVRLIIDANQFRGLTEDVMMEGCSREWMMVGKNKIEVEPKDKMKLKTGRSPDCFVAGTLIQTEIGPRPIETVQIGDLVRTPFGLSPVVATHVSEVNEITEARFTDGSVLRGKGKHEIFTRNRGWVRLDELSLTDRSESVRMLPLWDLLLALGGSSIVKIGTGFKAAVGIIHEAKNTVRRRDFFTALSGKTNLGLFLVACASIIKTVVGGTIGLQIWNCFRGAITRDSTCERILKSRRSWLNAALEWLKRLLRLRLGTDLRQACSGTQITGSALGLPEPSILRFARCAGTNSRRTFQPEPNSALSPVVGKRGEKSMSLIGSAWCAARALLAAGMSRRPIAPCLVQTKPVGPTAVRVYNLTLLHDNAYFANGILVANCFDALACGVEGARRLGFKIATVLSKSAVREDGKWRRQLEEDAKNYWRTKELTYN